MKININTINASEIQSLAWIDDDLVDYVSGGKIIRLNGEIIESCVRYGYKFTSSATLNGCDISVIYERNGTKGLVLEDGKVLREINRSFYHADAYEYPIALMNGFDGAVKIIHCPDSYCELVVEDAKSGVVENAKSERKNPDYFHSRIRVSPNGRYILCSGWVWHPLDVLNVYRIVDYRQNSAVLDSPISSVNECSMGEFIDDQCIIVGNTEGCEGDMGESLIGPKGLGVWDFHKNTWISAIKLDASPGDLMPVGKDHVLCLYKHPRLVNWRSGKVVQEFPQIESGEQCSSIINSNIGPIIAKDIKNSKIAISSGDKIHIIAFYP